MQNYPTIGKIILASASPRRRELLASLGLDFEIRIPDINEQLQAGENPEAYAERLAREKAAAVEAEAGTMCIAADTIVVLDGAILEKPIHEADALEMLSSLSGRMHEVITGMCVSREKRTEVVSVTTQVCFRTLEKEEIRRYISTGCPMDKAGAYAIQGGAAPMVREIRGSYTNVVGLPLCELHELLISF